MEYRCKKVRGFDFSALFCFHMGLRKRLVEVCDMCRVCTFGLRQEALQQGFRPGLAALALCLAMGVLFMNMGTAIASQNRFFSDVDMIAVECRVEASQPVEMVLKKAVETTAAAILKRDLPESLARMVVVLGHADERLVRKGTLTILLHGAVRPMPCACPGSQLVLGLSLFRSGPHDQYRERYPAAPEAVAYTDAATFTQPGTAEAEALAQALERMLSRALLDTFRPRKQEPGVRTS